MRRWVVWLHTYGLLLCAAYLLVLGASTILSNHPGDEPPQGPGINWQKPVPTLPAGTDIQRAESVRDQLGLMGWVAPWEIRREGDGVLRFMLTRPGKSYTIRLSADGKAVSADEKSLGIKPVLHAMHGMMNVPNSMLAKAWGWYTRICIAALVIAAVSGVCMFATRATERRVGLVLAAAGIVTALGLMLYLSYVA